MSTPELLRFTQQARSVEIVVNPDDLNATVFPPAGSLLPLGLMRDGDRWSVDVVDLPPPASDGEQPTAAIAESWPGRWCRVQIGMTAAGAQRVMGAVTSRFDGDPPELDWDFHEFGFTAFLGSGGRVARLQADAADLSRPERAGIGCPLLRTSR